MGALLMAQCPCGFSSGTIGVGGGMLNFTTYCGAPARCVVCGAFNVVNYLDSAPQCPQCGGDVQFYDDPALQTPPDPAMPSRRDVFNWYLDQQGRSFRLPDTTYQCPQCAELRLSFTQRGNWD